MVLSGFFKSLITQVFCIPVNTFAPYSTSLLEKGASTSITYLSFLLLKELCNVYFGLDSGYTLIILSHLKTHFIFHSRFSDWLLKFPRTGQTFKFRISTPYIRFKMSKALKF